MALIVAVYSPIRPWTALPLVRTDGLPACRQAARENSDKYVRVLLTVCMTTETEVVGDKSDLSKVTRDQLRCKITYCSVGQYGAH